MKYKHAVSFTLITFLIAAGLDAQQSEAEKRRQEQQRQQQQGSQSSRSEASKQELKVDEQEAQKEVTDINKASKVIGMKIVNKQNEEVGKIKDLVVDVQSGKIAYAVVSTGGTLGMGEKLVALPVESLRPMEGEKAFLIDADKDRLSQAPGFAEKDWPKIDAASESTVGLTPTGRPSANEPPQNQ